MVCIGWFEGFVCMSTLIEDFKAWDAAKGRINVSMLERLRIEGGTRSQSASSEWYLQ